MAFVFLEKYNKYLEFNEPIVGNLGAGNEVSLSVKQEGPNVVVDSSDPKAFKIPLRRPSFCPISESKLSTKTDSTVLGAAPRDPSNGAIPVATVALLESSRGDLLLTRRGAHMRAFPSVWVPPGGHVDSEETLENAALRELCEETGISLSPKEVSLRPLCAWESAYPTMLSIGTTRKHHLVLYYLVQPLVGVEPLAPRMSDEVDALTWLTKSQAAQVARTFDEVDHQLLPDQAEISSGCETFSCFCRPENDLSSQSGKWVDRPLSVLLRRVIDKSDHDLERVSTGTKYALYHWLKYRQNHTSPN